MKKRKHEIRVPGSYDSILKVLTNDWQTTSIISCQVSIPPDAIARATRIGSSKSELISQKLRDLVRSGKVEKRKITNTRNEYRLAQEPTNKKGQSE
jgi:DNA-binding HxlR family transcriptional regulator